GPERARRSPARRRPVSAGLAPKSIENGRFSRNAPCRFLATERCRGISWLRRPEPSARGTNPRFEGPVGRIAVYAMDRGSSSISHGGLAGGLDEQGERGWWAVLCRGSGRALLHPPPGRRHPTERKDPPGQMEIPRRRSRDRVALARDAGRPWRRAHAGRVRSV